MLIAVHDGGVSVRMNDRIERQLVILSQITWEINDFQRSQ